MFVLVSGATTTVKSMMVQHPNLGVLLCPSDGNTVPDVGVVWAADNSAYSGFDEARFRSFLSRIAHRPGCLWVVAPDVVGDAAATASLWNEWRPIIKAHGQRPALVAQDGLTARDVPWRDLDAVFIGGTIRYKLGEAACEIVGEANRRNIWTHMGRVNSARRMLFAMALGIRSIDGSGFSRYSKTHLPWALRVTQQRSLGLVS